MKKINITNGLNLEIVDILVKDVDVESLMDQISFLSCTEKAMHEEERELALMETESLSKWKKI